MPIVPKCAGGVRGRQFVGHSITSRSHRPPLGGHSRLHALHSLKIKIENSTCKNLPYNQLKSSLCLSSSEMPRPSSVEEIQKFLNSWSQGNPTF